MSQPLAVLTTGTTGYIGGDAAYAIYSKHKNHKYVHYGRNAESLVKVQQQLPGSEIIVGALEDVKKLSDAAYNADIVLHFAHADHIPAIKAILKGLAKRAAEGKPAFLIHTSGTGILLHAGLPYGDRSTAEFDDYEGINDILSIPDNASHKDVENIVQAAPEGVRFAIVAPATIYGVGRGAVNTRSIQVPWLAEHTLKLGHGIQAGKGLAEWNAVHVKDLSNLYLRLFEEAVEGGGSATWGKEGYYFGAVERFVWGEISRKIADYAFEKGYISSNGIKSYTLEEANAIVFPAGALWGKSSKANANRARIELGWEPVEKSLEEEVPEIVEIEYARLKKE